MRTKKIAVNKINGLEIISSLHRDWFFLLYEIYKNGIRNNIYIYIYNLPIEGFTCSWFRDDVNDFITHICCVCVDAICIDVVNIVCPFFLC